MKPSWGSVASLFFFFCHLEQTNISWEWQQRTAGNTPIRRNWKANGFMQICTCQGRLMLSKGENVEEKTSSSSTRKPFSCDLKFLKCFVILFSFLLLSWNFFFPPRICLSDEKPKWELLGSVLSETQPLISFENQGHEFSAFLDTSMIFLQGWQ